MTAAVKNLTIEQKATFKKRLVYRDKFKKPINLTGFGARMQIRDAVGALIADLSTANNKITLGGITGTSDLLLTLAETSAMQNIPMFYDIKLINPDLTEDRILQGKLTLSPGQTQ
jgi:hypothetical protein